MHSILVSVANVSDVTQVARLLHGEKMRSALMRAIPVSRGAKYIWDAKSSGRLQHGGAPTKNKANAAYCTK